MRGHSESSDCAALSTHSPSTSLWQALLFAMALLALAVAMPARAVTLTHVTSFGSNPGAIDMYTYVPSGLPSNAPLVVAMHGCTQSASDYANTGWPKYADMWGFAVVFPQQNSNNNQNKCFNWFQTSDISRGQGEALSIKQMVDYMKSNYSIDSSRVFVTGLSAGGYMTPVMLATYPDVFAGGGVFSGGPYKCATSMNDAFTCMSPGVSKSASAWGDLVRGAYSSYSGPYPIVSIWHGDSDYTVDQSNQTEDMKQWTNVHGIDQTADVSDTVKGYPHKVYTDSSGTPLVETYTITGMGHGTPVDPGSADDQCGTAGAYILDVSICSSYYVAKFWGLDNSDTQAPSVSLTNPTDSSSVSGNVSIQASASDNVGVTQVEFYVDGTLRATDTSSSYAYSWDTSQEANGDHTILAKAYDAAGNVGMSSQITVTVTGGLTDSTAPSVSLTFPTSGDKVYGTVTLAAAASDDFGVTKVEFFIDNTPVGSATEGDPWTLSWNSTTVSDGSHTVQAKAYDAAGNVGSSSSVSFSVNQNVESLVETFSDKDGNSDAFDASGWTASSGFTASSDNHTNSPAGSQSYLGDAESGSGCSVGTQTETLTKSVTLGDNPQLTYWRKLDLHANINQSTTANFDVMIDSASVDSEAVTYANYTESGWTQSGPIDLSSYANQTVTLKFRVQAYSNICLVAYAKAWIDDIRIANPQQSSDSTPPSVNITSPSDGSSVSGTTTINASASDNDSVAKVEFYVDGKLLGTDTSSSYSVSWDTSNVANGSHSLMAKAYDAAGNVATDDDTSVAVDNASGGGDSTAPTVNITAPSNSANVSGSVDVTASASDNVGVTQVEFYVDGSLASTDTSAPYAFTWDTSGVSNASHSLMAKAYDAAGNIGSDNDTSVTVDNSDGTAPTVSITAPTDGATVSGTQAITASASDNVGVSSVKFYVDGSLACTDSTAPYTCSWDTSGLTDQSSHTLSAKAYDAASNEGVSAAVSVTVSNWTCQQYTASNYNHVQAGRAHDSMGYAYADGSNDYMGLDNLYYQSTLRETASGYFEVGTCP